MEADPEDFSRSAFALAAAPNSSSGMAARRQEVMAVMANRPHDPAFLIVLRIAGNCPAAVPARNGVCVKSEHNTFSRAVGDVPTIPVTVGKAYKTVNGTIEFEVWFVCPWCREGPLRKDGTWPKRARRAVHRHGESPDWDGRPSHRVAHCYQGPMAHPESKGYLLVWRGGPYRTIGEYAKLRDRWKLEKVA